MNSSMFVGTRIRLTALRPDDAAVIARWYEDGDFSRLYDVSAAYPRSLASLTRWLEDTDRQKDVYAFAIRPLYSEDLLGIIDLNGILWNQRTAWLGIGIGDPEQRGRGYGEEAVRLILNFAFDELNLHRIQLTVFSYNERAIRLYERLGFVREGVMREALLRDGRRWDMLLFGILRGEWIEQRNRGETA